MLRRVFLAARLRYGRLEAMYQRDHNRSSAPGQTRSHTALPRRSAHPVLALQRLIGNRATTRVLARKKGPGTFEHSVKIGKLGPIEIKGGNIGDWVAKKDPENLVVTSTKGKHSDELKRMSDSKARIDTIEVQSIVGENSFVVITFRNARIRGYAADESGKTEEWKAVDFDAVHRAKTSIGAARP
jgi:hypothetical protein